MCDCIDAFSSSHERRTTRSRQLEACSLVGTFTRSAYLPMHDRFSTGGSGGEDDDEDDEALRPQPGLASPKYVTREGRAVPPLSASLLEAAAAAERGQQSAAGQSAIPQTARGAGALQSDSCIS